MKLKSLNTVSSAFILMSAICLGVEANFASRDSLQPIFLALDAIFVTYFTVELILRLRYKQTSWHDFTTSSRSEFSKFWGNNTTGKIVPESIEEWSWLLFDFILVIFTYLSFFRHMVEHPQIVLLLRLFRVFRIFKLFELNNTLKKIEKKIISAIPTIITFLILINIILYTYAVIGMYMYQFRKFESIDFTSVYNAMTGLFTLMTNGWSDTLKELRQVENVPSIITDAYIISFFIFSVLITLNVFLAVMTSQIQERIRDDMEIIKKQEDAIQKEISELEIDALRENQILNKKLDQIIEKISNK